MSKSQATVLSLLGSYAEMVSYIKENELLTPSELWTMFSNLPTDLTHCDLSETSATKVAQAIASHPNLAPEQVLFFLAQSKGGLKMRALVHPNFPITVLNQLIQEALDNHNLNNLEKLALNPNFDATFLDQIITLPILSGEYPSLIKLICKKATTPEHFEVLELFSLDNKHKFILLGNPHTPESFLNQFGDSFFHEVKLYEHPNCSLDLKQRGLTFLKESHPALHKAINQALKISEVS